jgi:hypothetical protein
MHARDRERHVVEVGEDRARHETERPLLRAGLQIRESDAGRSEVRGLVEEADQDPGRALAAQDEIGRGDHGQAGKRSEATVPHAAEL